MCNRLGRVTAAIVAGVAGCVLALAIAPMQSATADELIDIDMPVAEAAPAVQEGVETVADADSGLQADEPLAGDETVSDDAEDAASADEATPEPEDSDAIADDAQAEAGSAETEPYLDSYEAAFAIEGAAEGVEASEGFSTFIDEPVDNYEGESETEAQSTVSAAAPVLDAGQYVIRNVQAERLAISTAGSSKADGANAQLGEYNREDTQVWTLKPQEDGTYLIENAKTGYVLTVAALAPTPGTSVVMFHKNGNILQYWNLIETSGGFQIVSAADASVRLEVASMPAAGVNVRIGKASGSKNQLFYFVERFPTVLPGDADIEEGAYLISPMHASNMVVQVRDASYDAGTTSEIWSKNGEYEQKFYFDRDDDGYYVIANVHSGLVLDVRAADVLPRATVWQYEYNGSDAQKWAISVDPDRPGGYVLVNKATGTVLSVTNAAKDAGSRVQTHLNASSPSRSFALTRVSVVNEGVTSVRAELNDGLVIDVPGCSRDNNKQLWIYELNGTTAQKIYFRSAGLDQVTAELLVSGLKLGLSGNQLVQTGSATTWKTTMRPYDWRYGIEFVDTATGKAIECANRGYVNGTKLQVAAPSGDRGQLFLVERVPFVDDGLYVIHSAVGADKVLDLYDRHSGSGGNIDIWANYDIACQQFYIVNSGNGWYKIINAQTGLAIEAANSERRNGVNVEQTEWFVGADRQLWSPEIAPGGYMYFINKATGMALDVANTVNKDGTNVRMHAFNGQIAQKWYIRDTTLKLQYDPLVDDDVISRAYSRVQQYGSATNYFIAVDLSECRTMVFYRNGNGSWSLNQDFTVSPGAYSTPTVTGNYTITGKGYSFGSGYTCYYWSQFYGNYLFHSVLYYQGTRTIMDGRLGQHLSHGCVRMDIDDAYWIYSTIPYGTRVSIYW